MVSWIALRACGEGLNRKVRPMRIERSGDHRLT